MNQLDLFPADLLVSREGERIFTTSRKVAEHFHKRHTHVLDSIEKLLFTDINAPSSVDFSQPNFRLASDYEIDLIRSFNALNFEQVDYRDAQKKTRKEYRLTHDGFALLAMGFTGAKALTWKIKFLNAFRQMERQLFLRAEKYAAALDRVRPCLRPVVEATEAGCRRAEIALPLGKSVNAITYHRRVARKVGLLPDQESGREAA